MQVRQQQCGRNGGIDSRDRREQLGSGLAAGMGLEFGKTFAPGFPPCLQPAISGLQQPNASTWTLRMRGNDNLFSQNSEPKCFTFRI